MAIDTSRMKLTFRDEFNEFRSSAGASHGVWNTGGNTADASNGRNLNGAGQAVYYSDSSVGFDPYSVSDGVLTIEAIKGGNSQGLPYTSGMMNTRGSFSQQYGYFEMRAQLPEGKGYWPAFWMIRDDRMKGVEIDTLEAVGSEPGRIFTSIHTNTHWDFNKYSHGTQVGNTTDGFHTYGVNWTPTKISFYFDNKEVYSVATPSDLKAPMHMIVNFGVGARDGWGGAPNSTTPFPGEFKIDYVRAYDNGHATKIAGRAVVGNEDLLERQVTPGNGAKVVLGDGDYIVVGDPSKASVKLGDGDTEVDLGGWINKVTLGDGNHNVVLRNDGHALTLGDGNSTIQIKGSSNTVTIGDTTGTVIKANGYHQTISQTGDGKVTLTGTTGATSVILGDGAHVLTLGGSGNTVTVGDGNSVINIGTMDGTVTAGAGASKITIAGWNNTVDAGAGNDVIAGGKGHSTYVLDWLGQGSDSIGNFVASDTLDLGKALYGLGVKANLSNIDDFLEVRFSGGNTILSVDADNNDATAAVQIATLLGVQRSLETMIKAGNFEMGNHGRPTTPAPQPQPEEPGTDEPGTDQPGSPIALTLSAGNSNKAALIIKASTLEALPDGSSISIEKFGGAGSWTKGNNDFLGFIGFGDDSTLTYDRQGTGGVQIYDLHDSDSGRTYEFAVDSLNDKRLVLGDYSFF